MRYFFRVAGLIRGIQVFNGCENLSISVFSALDKKSSQRWHTQTLHGKSLETDLVKQLKTKIKMTGPITVAEYMQEVLSNPLMGYYMKKDVFGAQGDFITSPEISQMFGELIGIWFYDRWLHCGSPQNLQLVELGPGRGTLISDILRVFSKLGKISDCLSVHLVEISPAMKELQQTLLCGIEHGPVQYQARPEEKRECVHGVTKDGVRVTWHKSIFDVPNDISFYLAHEFFDALPIHQFQKTEQGWREVMVDIDEENSPHHLKFCLAPGLTPATVLIPEDTSVDQLEIRPQGQLITERMAQSISEHGGCSLIVDYGDTNCSRHSLRAFRTHELTSPLAEPGNSDLTSNVDFSSLNSVFSQARLETFGPVTQRNFLMSMGIDIRKQALLKKATPTQAGNIENAFRMLTESSQMGDCFKFFAALQHGSSTPPAGF